jgi:uncharacterized protein YbaR (Trm112 family)
MGPQRDEDEDEENDDDSFPMIDAELLSLLRCPETRQPLRHATPDECERAGFEEGLITADGRRIYPIRENIPVLLVDEGRDAQSARS